MLARRDRDLTLFWFFLASLLLHLLVMLLTRGVSLFPSELARQPVFVEMRDLGQERPRELDLPPVAEETPRTRPAPRLSEADRQVERERAPRGDAPDDTAPPPAPQSQPRTPRPPVAPDTAVPAPPGPDGRVAQTEPAPPEQTPAPRIDARTLVAAAQNPAARIAQDWRAKYRAEVEEGDAVWLDTEKDILASFFRRLRDQVYLVWGYPAEASLRGQEGTCLLRITINRDGTLARLPEIRESSGWPLLDREAVEAVVKAAPFGALPRAFPDESLTVLAFFQYTLGRKVIY